MARPCQFFYFFTDKVLIFIYPELWYDKIMKKETRKQLEKDFVENLKAEMRNAPKDKVMAIVYLLAFLSAISAIAALLYLFH